MTNKPELPACPVETTLMLIGDKWKYGGKRTADKRGFSGSAAESGIYTDGTWS